MTKGDKNLVIVESPAKAKTISRFLGKDFTVLSSYGHIRDLKASSFSVDIDNNFAPEYIIPDDKTAVVAQLKKAASKSEVVWLASDEDREGEAISWHLYEILERKGKPTHRIVFHEITERAIKKAIEQPREIDYNLVDAQQARRVLDRIVGFELSPVLWRRIKPSLSAGRVQSVAVRLIVDREREIQSFTPEVRFKTEVLLCTQEGHPFTAECATECATEEEAVDLVSRIASSSFLVQEVKKKPGKRSPAPPFTTSTLQQEAARKLGYSVSNTMRIAQKLYENGFITYMRTDSLALSDLALDTAATTIKETWGEEFFKMRTYKTHSKGAQEAHEAIRPTYISNASITGSAQECALYELIRKRTLASQMADAQVERTTVSIASTDTKSPISLTVTGEVIVFDGFLKVYNESTDEEDEQKGEDKRLPIMQKGTPLLLQNILSEERFSRPPARYTEASLVRKMEELGIGRPSTYAPTIQTIQNREYVRRGEDRGNKRTITQIVWEENKDSRPRVKHKTENFGNEKGKLLPTDIGIIVNDFLVANFPNVVDYNFTAMIEEQFDKVAEGDLQWQNLMHLFYDKFHPTVEKNMESTGKHYNGERILGKDPATGKEVSVRIGRFGPMAQLSATNDPESKPLFASIPAHLSITSITLEEALKLFELPRQLGMFEGKEVSVSVGRFGPFIKHNSAFVSIPKEYDLYTVTLPQAIELIQNKRVKDKESIIKTFDQDPELMIRKGRFGAYLNKGKINVKLTKEQKENLLLLTYEECVQLLSTVSGSKKTKKTASTKSKSTARKKSEKAITQ